MSSMVAPIALWGPSPPTHEISCLTVTPDQKTIVTGTSDGQICLWDLRTLQDNQLQLVPKVLIFGHSTPITALAIASDKWEKASIISAAEGGEIYSWDSDDGSCLHFQVQLYGTHTEIITFQTTSGLKRLWRVLVHGYYDEIYILDAATLEVVYQLQSKISPDWISAACVAKSTQSEGNTVLALCSNCVLKIWDIVEEPQDALFENEAKTLPNGDANCIRFNQFTNHAILIVFPDSWQVYNLDSYHLVYTMSAKEDDVWIGGDFIDVNDVVIWTQSGSAYVYRLPQKCLPDAAVHKIIRSVEEATLLHVLIGDSDEDTSNKPVLAFSYGSRGSFFKLVIQGNANGELLIWKLFNNVTSTGNYAINYDIKPITYASLADPWKNANTKPTGILDNLDENSDNMQENPNPLVSATLFIADRGILICGCDSGEIYVTDACLITTMQLLDHVSRPDLRPILQKLKGHNGRVTCLLHPYSEVTSYEQSLLVSGGSDFIVNLWNLDHGTLLYTFAVHGGGITKLMCCPQDGSTRLANCICSISKDHSVSILSLTERKCILLAGRHVFPIQSIRWRLAEDFLIISCTDGTTYVWQIETGYLDRCVGGNVAIEILQCCDESLHTLVEATNNMVPQLQTTSGGVSSHVLVTSSASYPNLQDGSTPTYELQPPTGLPLRITAVRANSYDSDIQILFFDTEALISHLLYYDNIPFEEIENMQDNEGIIFNTNTEPVKVPRSLLRQIHMTYDSAQLELSCLHAWDLDPNLDKICVERLGLLHPIRPVSFGILSKRRSLSLIVPGWEPYCPQLKPQLTTDKPLLVDIGSSINFSIGADDALSSPKERSFVTYSHWMLSNALTTQHMLAIISVSNTLMEMAHPSFISEFEEDRDCSESMEDMEERETREVTRVSQIKAGWSQIATLHCVLLSDKLGKDTIKAPLLEVLARRWQHKCLEIREAAQALLLAELERIGHDGRQQIIELWSPHIPRNVDSTSSMFGTTENNVQPSILVSPSIPQNLSTITSNQGSLKIGQPPRGNHFRRMKSVPAEMANMKVDRSISLTATNDFSGLLSPVAERNERRSSLGGIECGIITTKVLQRSTAAYEFRRRQITAIVMLGVVGAEFCHDFDPSRIGKIDKGVQIAVDSDIVMYTAKALQFLILRPNSPQFPANSTVRRAAIDLLGRGFSLWMPYLDVPGVILMLLDLSCEAVAKTSSNASTPSLDTSRTAKHALSLIATSKPALLITTLSVQIGRYGPMLISLMQSTPPGSQPPVFATILFQSRAAIVHIMELLVEKAAQEVVDLLVEVVNIILHCLDQILLKSRNLPDSFPSLFKFNMVSYCSKSKRVAVGGQKGQVVIFDTKSIRSHSMQAHSAAVTALAFSTDGRIIATFSLSECRLNFWQIGSTTNIFGMIGNFAPKNVKSCKVKMKGVHDSHTIVQKLIRIVWFNQKELVLLTNGVEQRFSL